MGACLPIPRSGQTPGWYIVREILAQDADGLPRHRLAYIELSRGHFKTGAAAAVAIIFSARYTRRRRLQ